jgi:uncharacterized repeat protein (TIGR03803 family)
MRTLNFGGYAVGFCVAALAFVGCGGGAQPPVSAPGAMPQDKVRVPAPTETVLYSFAGGKDGADPQTAPISVRGELYGTTSIGGGGCRFVSGCGVVYRVNASGNEHLLHVFTSGKDGEAPTSLIASRATLFGTTAYGGASGCKTGHHVEGCGTIFELGLSGKETVLYAFPGGAPGAEPYALFPLGDTFFGEAAAGGVGKCYYASTPGCGLIFKMRLPRHVSVLHTFEGAKSGGTPIGGLLSYKHSFFGTTQAGGHTACLYSYGCGTTFSMTPSGKVTILHAFGRELQDAALPDNGLVLLNGTMYGTTFSGGSYDCALTGSFSGCGTAFGMTPSGHVNILYDFTGQTDGAYPNGLIAMDGNLYGTTQGNGAYRCGTVFELTPSGQETTIYSFKGAPDGCGPASGLTDVAGTLYGTTEVGGAHGYGTVYALTP